MAIYGLHTEIVRASDGSPAVGEVSVYETGTTTLATLARDEDGTTAQDNPVQLDHGRLTFYATPGAVDLLLPDGTTVEDVQIAGDPDELAAGSTLITPVLTLKQSASPTPTAEGDIQWDTDDNKIIVGDGATAKTFTDDSLHVLKSAYDANTVLYATTDNTPAALTVGASTVVGRKATGDIVALSASESRTVLGLGSAAVTNIGEGLILGYAAKTSTHTATISDYLIDCDGTFTVTLMAAAVATGRVYVIKNSGVGTITVDGDGAELIDGQATQPVATTNSMTVISTGTAWVIV